VFDWLDPSQHFAVDVTLITTLMVLSVHLVFRAGIFSLASAGFAAIGAYTTAVLATKEGWSTWPSILAATLLPSVLAVVFAVPVLRLRGIYLALGSIALSEVIVILIENTELTNKTLGFIRIPKDVNSNHFVLILAVVFALLQLHARSHRGRAVEAVRLDERTASGLGIDVRRVRTAAFVASAALAGLAGALEAHHTTVIGPENYGMNLLLPLFTYALIGGNNHWLGPVLTCWGLTALRHWWGFDDANWENIAYGVLLVVVVLLAPGGLTDPALRRRARARLARFRGRGSGPIPAPGTVEAGAT